MSIRATTIAATLGLLAARAGAQPAPEKPPESGDEAVLDPYAPDPGSRKEAPDSEANAADAQNAESAVDGASADPAPEGSYFDPNAGAAQTPPPPPQGPVLPNGDPRLFVSQTGTLVPAAVIYSNTGLDTSGGFASDLRIGLGGVGEFGIEHFDQVRWTRDQVDEHRVAPLFLATFKLGLPEDRFFHHQPAVAIGLRKSFQAEESIYHLRMAELFVVATRSVTDSVRLHLGGLLGDAEIENTETGRKVYLHDRPLRKQARLYGGFELETLPRSRIIVEWNYVPLFRLQQEPQPDDMSLRAQLLWGIRYSVTRSTKVEAGVRIGDIANADLIDAHIFGRLTFTTDALARAFD